MDYISNAAKNFKSSGIRKMFELGRLHEDAIKLSVGEPNFNTPESVKEIAKKALDENMTHYVTNKGLDELREIIAEQFNQENQTQIDIHNIMVTVGGMEAILLGLLTTVDRGDEVIIPNPSFPNYLSMIEFVGAKPVLVPVYEENDFNIIAEDIEKAITPNTKAIILNSPSNPLGAVMTRENIEKIAEVVDRHNLLVISDEVYDKIVFDDCEHFSMMQIPKVRDKVMVANSFSKTYAMTGWRVGFIVAHEDIIKNMYGFQESIATCVPGFVQVAAAEALKNARGSVQEMVGHYERRRDLLVNGLNQIPGISCRPSRGSIYVFANVKAFEKPSEELAIEFLEKAKVVSVPGSAFGTMGEGYLRMSFANSDENIVEAVDRIKTYVESTYSF